MKRISLGGCVSSGRKSDGTPCACAVAGDEPSVLPVPLGSMPAPAHNGPVHASSTHAKTKLLRRLVMIDSSVG
jgi:hypothetical protein